MELFDFAPSGNCHKIRLMLSFLQTPYQLQSIDPAKFEQKSPAFLTMNPWGQLPVLKDGKNTIWDSQAILVYLARQSADPSWLPLEADSMGRIMQWLSVAANEVAHGPALLRLHYKFGRFIDVEASQKIALTTLTIVEQQLKVEPWLAAKHITIADLAIYPYLALAPEAKLDLTPYPAICQWLRRIQSLPNYVGMPGMWEQQTSH
jgi:glutathione S-transferase